MRREPTKRPRWRVFRVLFLLAAVAVLLWLGSSYGIAYRLTRRPHPRRDEPAPALAGATVQTFRLATEDGEDLGAWFHPGRPDRPLVVLLHGNGSDRSSCLDQAEALAQDGCSVL